MRTKAQFPESIQDALNKFTAIVDEMGFFDDPNEIPPTHKEQGRVNLWNTAGEELLDKFFQGSADYIFTEDEVSKILVNTIIQTNLDSLMEDKLIDGIEDENGEMRYWMTDKGKELHKSLGPDTNNC